MIKTIEQARSFVKKVKLCTIFPSDKVELPSLWEQVDLPDKQKGETGWGQKMNAVWTWKNLLPERYPNDVFYGKIKGGLAVLMDMNYMVDVHFPKAYKPISALSKLAQYVNEQIDSEPQNTTTLRKSAIQDTGCTKSQFDGALKNLQITMNIVRSIDPQIEQDTWVPFKELYLEAWQRYVDASET